MDSLRRPIGLAARPRRRPVVLELGRPRAVFSPRGWDLPPFRRLEMILLEWGGSCLALDDEEIAVHLDSASGSRSICGKMI